MDTACSAHQNGVTRDAPLVQSEKYLPTPVESENTLHLFPDEACFFISQIGAYCVSR